MFMMAIDQYGEAVHGLKHPRKELCAKHGVKHADKIYVDLKTGKSRHVGYVIAGHWYRIFKIERWKE